MTDYKLVPGTPAAWRASDDFPGSLPNTWSRGVVAVTDFGRVCILSCMGTYWQRPADFAEGEEVVAWADFPDLERATDALDVQGEPDVEKLIRLSDYEALQAECEKLRKDADRYRWLLNNSSVILDRHAWFKAESGTLIESTMPTPRELDAAIDAAIQGDNQ